MEWYALRVKPQHEKTVSISLQGKGYTEFLPVYPSQRRSARNSHKPVHLPLFPGYVFARFDVERRLPILTIPGVLFVLSINRIPIPVSAEEIAAVEAVVRSGLETEPWPYLRAGQQVMVSAGPLQGLQGILVTMKNEFRVIVSVTLLQRSIAVEVDRSWVHPVKEQPLFAIAGAVR